MPKVCIVGEVWQAHAAAMRGAPARGDDLGWGWP